MIGVALKSCIDVVLNVACSVDDPAGVCITDALGDLPRNLWDLPRGSSATMAEPKDCISSSSMGLCTFFFSLGVFDRCVLLTGGDKAIIIEQS